ncbi:MAG TPA: hypothetical protein VG871_21330, partial [Vicinamibacterales bacterium]|nr:hypothetical protein [Vicinamibacterales bacterium]
MSIRKPLLILLTLLPLVVTGSACGRSGSTTGTPAKPVIAVIPKGTTHEYWKSVHAGAVKAARDHGAEI